MVDARVNSKQAFQRSLAARPEAAKALLAKTRTLASEMVTQFAKVKRELPGLEVKFSNLTGAPTIVVNNQGPLTAAAPGQSSETIVRAFLAANGALYGLSAVDLADLAVLGDSPGGSSGLRMLRMEQRIDGRPVFQSETRFLLDREGRLVESLGQMVPHARSLAPSIDEGKLLSPADAVAHLLTAAGHAASAASFTVTGGHDGRLELAQNLDFLKGTITARQVLFPLAPGVLVPAWSLVVFTTGQQDWYAMVDAETGDVLWRKNIRNYASAHDARFRVYVQADGITPADSPAPQSPNTVAPGAGTQFPGIAPVIVSMHTAYDPVASPNGWINDCPAGGCTANETQTLGNNALICVDQVQTGVDADVCDTGAATIIDGNGRPTGNPDANARNRDFLGTAPRDFQTNFLPPPQAGNPESGQTSTGNGTSGTAPIDQFRRGMMTHLFYSTNWYHDKLFALGFDEASANFQQTNFSGMGVGNDRVLGDADDGSAPGANNANFATPPDGTSGRMQMYRFTGPTIDRDAGLDAEIFMHELTHGVSNRLVGNAAGLNWDPAAGMGEGWSDFVALSLLNNTNADNPNGQYASGAYATYKFGGAAYLDNYVYGIRRFPYTTDNTINPMTWADVDDVTNNLSGGITPDPLGANTGGAMEVHNAGEVWALTLWEVRSRIIGDPAGANGDVPTGNHTMLQLVIDGLKMTPIDPSFTDARDAILKADCATHACANEMSIWSGFADRGLGYGAKTPYNIVFGFVGAHMGILESFKVPFLDVVNKATDVTINDSATNNNGAIDPGEAVKLTVKLTNPWRGATKAVVSAVATLSSSTPGVTIIDNTSTYGPIAPQGTATGDTFTIAVDPSVLCGSALDFTLTTVSNLGTTSTTFQLRVGGASGTDPVVTYTDTIAPALTITNNRPRGVFHQLNVTDDFVISDLNFRINSVTMARTIDFTAMLRSPGSIGTDFISLIDAVVDNTGGANITNMVIDDDLPITAANDMVQATTAAAPYTKSWLPVFNAPWPPLGGFPTGPDPVGNLSRFDGTSTKGTWSALVSDQGVATGGGTFNGWSMLVTPVHFACTAVSADLGITKTDGVTTATPGGSVTYTITASNASVAGATGATVADTFPAVLTCAWTCVGAGGGTCTASGTGNINDTVNLPAGASVTYTATCAIAASAVGTLSNTATVTLAGDPNAANNSATDTDTLTPQANLGITKTDGVTTATPGGSVTYTITASNAGPSNAPGSSVADTFPASLTCTWTCVGAGGGTCTASGSGNIGDTVNLPSGGSVTYTASCNISAAATGTLSNTATVATGGGVTDPTPGNNSATDSDTLAASANLGITKTDGVTTATPGGSVTYTITASNAGPSNATGATVADTFPASLTCTWTCAGAAGGTCTASGTGNINDTVNLPNGGSVTYTASCNISAAASGSLSNTATVTAPAGVTDPTPANNSATDVDGLGATADLAITKTDGVTTATPGGSVTYTITATNTGPSNATGATVTDTFPASLACTWTCVGAGGGTCTASGTGNINNTVNLPSSGSVTYTASCNISAAATGTLSNTATVTAPAGVTDPTPANNSATDTDTLAASANLGITKTDGVTTVTAGGPVTYTITASNAGPSNATGATVADTFPASLTCTWTCTGAVGGTCTASGTGNINDTVNLPAGGSVTYIASCTLSNSATGTLANTATVTAPAGVTDPTPGNNSATDSDTITPAATPGASVSGTKTASGGPYAVGGTLTYTIVLNNTGAGAQGDNPGNELTDVLPATLALVSATATSGNAVATTGTNTVTWNGAIPAGGSVTITITATILPSAVGTTVSNQGTISFDADGNGSNESTAQTDDPGVAGAANSTNITVPGTVEVPTLSELGLLALGLCLLLAGWSVLRRRKTTA
ncbi:MAG TPA: IPTL-CTERM sorting domain-containing protein [Thermoanaerobaculia bacterium]|jgi:uncharacterized repeat protein (TIGR01451 family)|nr:IPTL-CTERM sorting domain-containing protein [Thermoanaerobaculia bacterium]